MNMGLQSTVGGPHFHMTAVLQISFVLVLHKFRGSLASFLVLKVSVVLLISPVALYTWLHWILQFSTFLCFITLACVLIWLYAHYSFGLMANSDDDVSRCQLN